MPKKTKADSELSNGHSTKRQKVEKHRVDDVNIRKLTPLVPPGCVLEVCIHSSLSLSIHFFLQTLKNDEMKGYTLKFTQFLKKMKFRKRRNDYKITSKSIFL